MITIDDFQTGQYTCTLSGTTPDIHCEAGSAGSILGGVRRTDLYNALDPRHTPVTLDVGNSDRLNLTIGAGQYVRLELCYGWNSTGAESPLGADLSEGSGFRTNFWSIGGALNYNIVAFLQNPQTGGLGWTAHGANLGPSAGATPHDFPFASFDGPGGNDFTNVSFLIFVFQTMGDIALDSLEVVV